MDGRVAVIMGTVLVTVGLFAFAPAFAQQGVERSAGRIGDELVVERASGDVLRLTCRDDFKGAQEVDLFLADAEQKVLAAQTLRAAPFTAPLDLAPGTAYVGMTLRYPDGVTETTRVPYTDGRIGSGREAREPQGRGETSASVRLIDDGSARRSPLVGAARRVGDELVVQRLAGGVVRLTWQDEEEVEAVSLFVAGARENALALQTVRAAPFTALLDMAPERAYVGAVVDYRNGIRATTLIPAQEIALAADDVRLQPRAPSAAPAVEPPYTGLLLDALDLDLQRAMAPRIVDVTGRVVYPNRRYLPDMDFLQEHGMASYVTDVASAQRSGSDPLIIRAVAVAGPGRDDLVISREAADLILDANRQGHFLERWAVSVLIRQR
jgi:hypothetical protein